MTPAQSVTEYIAAQPRPAQTALKRVRSAIRKALPDAEEVISYQIPAYKLHKRIVLYFAGWKEHYSLYPVNAELVAAFKKQLAPYETSGRGTVRFPLSEPVPVALIERVAKFRAKQVAATQSPAARRSAPHPRTAAPASAARRIGSGRSPERRKGSRSAPVRGRRQRQ
jgi:uncharacterized protein YdhG (YjbR/CyaY superfamily)